MSNLLNISPIDGRYYNKTRELSECFSEYALIKNRVFVEIKWLLFLIDNNIVKEKISSKERNILLNFVNKFDLSSAERVKEYESITKHDVKAVEYFLQEKLKDNKLDRLIPFIHITLTSEDINNTSYNLMIKDGLDIYLKELEILLDLLKNYSITYKKVVMLGHTHGQVATPTTVGKEFKVFEYRIKSVLNYLENIKLKSKFSGAVGNYNCHVVAYPDVDWIDISKKFINSLNLEYNPVTTQIESHDILCLLLSNIKIINNIIKDLNSDMWLYISRGYFKEKMIEGEVGSSVMPHKINPINHENSMANIELSNSLIDALVNNLSVSRMQRDLSDSSKLRNLGVIFAHSLISIKETVYGLSKMEVNDELLKVELNSHFEVLCEAIQTVLRKNKVNNAYEELKEFSRGKNICKEDIKNFVYALDICKEDKKRLLNLTPENYIGLVYDIIDNN